MTKQTKDERRSNYPRPEQDLYKMSNIEGEITSERRVDELDRMREIQEQKRTWQRTMLFCAIVNLALLVLAFVGGNG